MRRFLLTVGIVAVLEGVLFYKVFGGRSDPPPASGTATTPDTVLIAGPEVIRTIREEAEPSIVERIITRELPPDTVFVQRDRPRERPRNPVSEFAASVAKRGDRVEFRYGLGTGEAGGGVWTLPSNDADYTIRAINTDVSLRTPRNLGIHFGTEIGTGLWYTHEGMLVADIRLAGPVSIGGPRTRIFPEGYLSSDSGFGIGVRIRTRFWGGP